MIGSSKNPLTANENMRTQMPKLKSKIGMDRNSVVVPKQQQYGIKNKYKQSIPTHNGDVGKHYHQFDTNSASEI